MAHARTQIRDAYKAHLTGLATTGSNVFVGREHPLAKGITAALRLFTRSDSDVLGDSTMSGLQVHQLHLSVEAVAVGRAAVVEDQVDQIDAEVNAVIYAFPAGLEVKSIAWTSTTIEVDAQAAEAVARAEMVYEIEYCTREGAPEVLI